MANNFKTEDITVPLKYTGQADFSTDISLNFSRIGNIVFVRIPNFLNNATGAGVYYFDFTDLTNYQIADPVGTAPFSSIAVTVQNGTYATGNIIAVHANQQIQIYNGLQITNSNRFPGTVAQGLADTVIISYITSS